MGNIVATHLLPRTGMTIIGLCNTTRPENRKVTK